MSILYYFKPPQFIPAGKILYEENKISKGRKVRKKKRVFEADGSYEETNRRVDEEEEMLVLSLMLEGVL